MRINTPTESGILKLDETDFASLTLIDASKYKYKISYHVNFSRALQLDCQTVKIDLLSTLTSALAAPSLSGASFGGAINNILTSTARAKDARRVAGSDIIQSYVSDFTSRVNNEHTSKISSGMPVQNFSTAIELRSSDDPSIRTLSLPILQRHSFKEAQTTQRDSILDKQASTSLIYDYGIDPSIIGNRSNFIVPAKTMLDGTIPLATPTALPGSANTLIDSLIPAYTPVSRNSDLSSSQMIPVVVQTATSFIKVDTNVYLPINNNSVFYLRLTLLNKLGNIVDSVTKVVDHPYLVTLYKQPIIPPLLNCNALFLGKNILEFSQQDNKAKSIKIYRKVVNRNIADQENDLMKYVFLAEIECTVNDGILRYEDDVANYNPVIYRAISIGQDNVASSEFNNSVTAAVFVNSALNLQPQQNHFALTYAIVPDGISLEARDIPSNIIGIQYYRQNLTTFEKKPVVVSDVILTIDKHSALVAFVDKTAEVNQTYRYTCKLLDLYGKEEPANLAIIAEFRKKNQDKIVLTTTSAVAITPTGLYQDISFKLTTSINQSVVGSVQSSLKNQSENTGYFSEDFTTARNDLQTLIAYHVVRHNLTTGEISDFGIVTDREFSDIKYGQLAAVSPPQQGCDYRYEITTLLRESDTILDITKTIKVRSRDYETKPSRWQHPAILQHGSLFSNDTLVRTYGKTEFLFGEIGDITTVKVSLPNTLPYITEVKAQKINTSTISIKWQILGDTNKIDHFIVLLEMIGMRTIVGKAHGISENGVFTYIDELTNGERGMLRYIVLPVYNDYSRGAQVRSLNDVIV